MDPEVAIIIYKSTFDLICTVTSLTIPNITWLSSALACLSSQSSITSHIATHTSILTLEQVNMNYTGTYTCTAVNEGGLDAATANITIVGKEYDKIEKLRNVVMFDMCIYDMMFSDVSSNINSV